MTMASLFDFALPDLDGREVPLSRFAGKVLLLVNVASKCGFTPQYAGLQALYERYRDRGLEVLGFPANNFLFQEPGSNAQIKSFCSLTYGVSFPLFAKISVRGRTMHPLYRFLTDKSTNPRFGGPGTSTSSSSTGRGGSWTVSTAARSPCRNGLFPLWNASCAREAPVNPPGPDRSASRWPGRTRPPRPSGTHPPG
jgi:glutathione peroxidase